MSSHELAKEIVVAAIQNGYVVKAYGTAEEGSRLSKANAENIAEFYKTIFKAVCSPNS